MIISSSGGSCTDYPIILNKKVMTTLIFLIKGHQSLKQVSKYFNQARRPMNSRNSGLCKYVYSQLACSFSLTTVILDRKKACTIISSVMCKGFNTGTRNSLSLSIETIYIPMSITLFLSMVNFCLAMRLYKRMILSKLTVINSFISVVHNCSSLQLCKGQSLGTIGKMQVCRNFEKAYAS